MVLGGLAEISSQTAIAYEYDGGSNTYADSNNSGQNADESETVGVSTPDDTQVNNNDTGNDVIDEEREQISDEEYVAMPEEECECVADDEYEYEIVDNIHETYDAEVPPTSDSGFIVELNADGGNSGTILGWSAMVGGPNDGQSQQPPRALVIPTEIDGVLITRIGDSAFFASQLTSVALPGSLVQIGSYAFAHNQLTSVTLPSSLSRINSNAFIGNRLTSINFPTSLTYIGNNAFALNQLTSVTIPNSVTSIGGSVFFNNNITSVSIGSSLATIPANTFAMNRLSGHLEIPSTVTHIGVSAFSFNYLTSVYIPSSVGDVRQFAFADNHLLGVTMSDATSLPETGTFANNHLIEQIPYRGGYLPVGAQSHICSCDFAQCGHRMLATGTITQATCTAEGEAISECQRFGCTHTDVVTVAALGHNMGDWFVIVPATTATEGVERSNCRQALCDHFITRPLAMLDQTAPPPETPQELPSEQPQQDDDEAVIDSGNDATNDSNDIDADAANGAEDGDDSDSDVYGGGLGVAPTYVAIDDSEETYIRANNDPLYDEDVTYYDYMVSTVARYRYSFIERLDESYATRFATDSEAPLFGFDRANMTSSWSLINFILLILIIALAILNTVRLMIRRNLRRQRVIRLITSGVIAICIVILYVLTQNMSAEMVIADWYTTKFALAFITVFLSSFLANRESTK